MDEEGGRGEEGGGRRDEEGGEMVSRRTTAQIILILARADHSYTVMSLSSSSPSTDARIYVRMNEHKVDHTAPSCSITHPKVSRIKTAPQRGSRLLIFFLLCFRSPHAYRCTHGYEVDSHAGEHVRIRIRRTTYGCNPNPPLRLGPVLHDFGILSPCSVTPASQS